MRKELIKKDVYSIYEKLKIDKTTQENPKNFPIPNKLYAPKKKRQYFSVSNTTESYRVEN